MNGLQIFNNAEFGEIRTLTENGKTLFCATDVAKSLGYSNTRDAISKHCRCVAKRDAGVQTGTKANGTPAMRKTEMTFILEGDVYRLIAHSKLPAAVKFESWVFDEVLPSIRKTGSYALPQDYPSALRALADTEEKRLALAAENEAQRQIIADFEPIKQYVDTILASTGTMTITQIAADYDMSAKKLNKILHEEEIQRCVNGQWILYKQHMGKGYTKSVTFNFYHSDGRQDAKPNTQWTQKGRLLIHEILTARGILAVMDRQCA